MWTQISAGLQHDGHPLNLVVMAAMQQKMRPFALTGFGLAQKFGDCGSTDHLDVGHLNTGRFIFRVSH
jgi:hypothetical protein